MEGQKRKTKSNRKIKGKARGRLWESKGSTKARASGRARVSKREYKRRTRAKVSKSEHKRRTNRENK